MAGGQWEVVGGKTKKNKAKNGAPKAQKEKNPKDSPNFETSAVSFPPDVAAVSFSSGPICESPTMFNAFLEKGKKETPKLKGNGNEKGKDKNIQQKKKKDKKSVTASSKMALEEVFSSVTEEDLKNLLATLEVLCPDSPLVWLKDVASFCNVKLDVATEDPTFASKPIGYPSILLSKGVYALMVKLFNRCTPQMLQLFFEHCLQNMVQDTLKGLHTVGYRTVLQCLAQEMPSVVTTNLSKCAELCNSHQNRQNICISVMWAAGQAGNNNLEAGFRVWIDLMFPLIGTKTCTSYAVDYLEKLVSYEDVSKTSKSILGVRDLFPILDFIYSKDLVKSVQKRLLVMYPTLKALSYGPQPETLLRNYFPSYLRRLEPHCPQALKEEILASLVYCLEKDNRSYSIWRQLYSKHFIQSKLLIAHLNDQWEKLPAKFPKRSLFDTLSVFQVTNEELLNSGKGEPDVEECILINKELLSKMNSQIFSWLRISLLFILIFSILLTYDIMIHDSFIDSNTGKLMKDAGLLVICAQASEKLLYYYGKTYKLLEKYLPVFIVWSQKTFGPYFELFWKKLSVISVYIWNNTGGIRLWCNENVPSLLALIEEQSVVYGRKMSDLVSNLLPIVSAHLHTALEYVWQSSEAFVIWLQSNKSLTNSLETFQKYAVALSANLQQWLTSVWHFVESLVSSPA